MACKRNDKIILFKLKKIPHSVTGLEEETGLESEWVFPRLYALALHDIRHIEAQCACSLF